MSTMTFGPKSFYPIGRAFAWAHCLIQTQSGPKQHVTLKPCGGCLDRKILASSEALSSPTGRTAVYKLFIHGSLNSLHLKTIILNNGIGL